MTLGSHWVVQMKFEAKPPFRSAWRQMHVGGRVALSKATAAKECEKLRQQNPDRQYRVREKRR
jgi:hypothetical protein